MSYRFLMIYGLITDWMDSLLMGVGKTVGRAGFGRKIRGPVLSWDANHIPKRRCQAAVR